jgi:hypothetical protein
MRGAGKVKWVLRSGIQPTKNAYEIAKTPGAKHHKTYIDYRIKTSRELNKGIRSFQRRIDEHRKKLANPPKCYPDWDTFTPDHTQREITSWQTEIKRFSEQMEIFKGCLQEKK